MKIIEFLLDVKRIPVWDRTPAISDKDLEDLIRQFVDTDADVESVTLHEEIQEYESTLSHLEQKLKSLKESANYCKRCGMYYPKEQAKQAQSTEEGTGCDPDLGGYGDDDVLYDCTYLITSDVCPLCGGLTEVSRYKTNVRNRHYRWQTKREVWM